MNAWRFSSSLVVLLAVFTWPSVQTSEAADEENHRFGGFDLRDAPLAVQAQLAAKTRPDRVPYHRLSVKADDEFWTTLVDETWGEGLPTKRKLWVFDRFWSTIDRSFACFQDIEVDWDGLREQYRSEIEGGVSRGRFAAIMSRLSMALMDAQTRASDKRVEWKTRSAPGIPLLHVGGWGLDTHFGAGLTPLPDKSLLVYSTVPAHPLGLEPGDVVLGYEGRPWSELYPELLALGLPVTGLWGSAPPTWEHAWLMAAGLNWHLFDTIDIRKFGADEVLQLPTSPMTGLITTRSGAEAEPSTELWITEQLAVDGVPFPDFDNGQLVSWGLVEGTNVGYIFCWGWYWDAGQEFLEAVHNLMYEHETEGLIIDLRFNPGGDLFLSNPGLELLFDQTVRTIDLAERCDDSDHLELCAFRDEESFLIHGDPGSFYDKPIAVLIGPGAVGAGDQVALRLGFQPNVSFFGKSTNTAFGAPEPLALGAQWDAHYARADAFDPSEVRECLASDDCSPFSTYQYYIHNDWGDRPIHNPATEREFLTHDPFPVDYPVWLTTEDAAVGRDTVVEAAVQWIMTLHK